MDNTERVNNERNENERYVMDGSMWKVNLTVLLIVIISFIIWITISNTPAAEEETFQNLTFKNSTFKNLEQYIEITNRSTTEKNEEEINSMLPKDVLMPTVMPDNETKSVTGLGMFIRVITGSICIMILLAYTAYWILNKYCTEENDVQQQQHAVQYNPRENQIQFPFDE